MISPAARDALQGWLASRKALHGASENTVEAYAQDVAGFLAFMTEHHGEMQGLAALARIETADMRAWMAHTRSHGVGARALARKLSAVKGFYRWLAAREGFEPTAVLSIRAPKFQPRLPRPLSPQAASDVIATLDMQSATPWIIARDQAVVTLLYGCGLRISEALGLTGAVVPMADMLRITGKGGKERLVPVIAPARDAVARYADLCPFDITPGGPLFSAYAVARSGRGRCRRSSSARGGSSGCRRRPRRTRCATALPRIC